MSRGGPRPRGRTKASQFDGSVRPLRYVSGGGWASARQPGSPYYVRQSPRVRARTGSDLSGPALGFTITVSCPSPEEGRKEGRKDREQERERDTRLRTSTPKLSLAAPFLSSPFLRTKLVNGSRVGQVGPVDSCGQVGDLDPSLVNSRNLS